MDRARSTAFLATAFLLLLTACRSAAPPPAAAVSPAPDERYEGDSRRSARQQWFLRQRLFPFHSFDEDLRAKAFAGMRAMEPAAATASSAGEVQAWVPIGPAPTDSFYPESFQRTSGRIRAVAISRADPDLVLIGSSSGGIWRSTDGAATFLPVSDDQADLSIASIVFAPSDPSIVYAGMGGEFLGSGVLKSTDAGMSWRRVDEAGLPPMAQAVRIAVHPTNPDVVLLAQSWSLGGEGELEPSKVFQSLDGGRTWTARLGDFPTDVLFDPFEPSIAYAALPTLIPDARPPVVYRSLDAGTTWEAAFTAPLDAGRYMTIRLAVAPARTGRVYAYAYGSLGTFLWISDDHGVTWREQSLDGVRGRAVLFESDPQDADILYLGQFVDLFRSTDAGATWSNLTRNRNEAGRGQYATAATHPDQFSIAFLPGTGGEFLLGNDGGLYRSSEGGTVFTHLNDTLSLTQIYGIAAHPRVPGLLFIGTQDNGVQVRDPRDGGWTEVSTGDYGDPWIDPSNEARFCTNYYFASIFCFNDYGATLENVISSVTTFEPSGDPSRIGFLAPLAGNGEDGTLYFGTWRLWITTDLGEQWTAPGGDLDLTRGGFDVMSAIAVAPSDSSVIYSGSAEGRVMRSADAGVTWSDVSNGIPERFVTSITVHRRDPDRVWLTLSGFLASHVFASVDGGATWTDLQANLPDIPVNALWLDPRNDAHLLAGTDIGVFRTLDGGASWAPFSEGLPPVIVKDFATGPDRRLYAATHGRGVYALRLERAERNRPVRR